ncbi:MAG: hypothetical protein ABIU84_13580 [Thermoanaerobaculia bacterium]
MRTRLLLFAALLLSLLALGAAPAEADSPTIRVDIDNDHGEDVHLTVNGGLIGTFIRAMAPIDIDCDHDEDDPKVRALYLTLERGGDGTRGTVWDDDKQIDARRNGKFLEMKIHDEDGDTVDLTLPWSLARCVLGGEDLSRKEIDRAMAAGSFSIHVRDEDSNVHVSID